MIDFYKLIQAEDVEGLKAAIAEGNKPSPGDLTVAAALGKDAVVEVLAGQFDQPDAAPMIKAASNGHLNVLEVLLDAGFDVDLAQQDGTTALTYAVLENRPEVVEFLLDAGADINRTDGQGRVALDIAIKFKSRKAAQFLIDRGATYDDKLGAQLAKLGVELGIAPAEDDTSRREEAVGRWTLSEITFEGDPASQDFRGSRTRSAEELGYEDTFVEFKTDASVIGKYIFSEFQGTWTIDKDRIVCTDKLKDTRAYRLSKDGTRLLMQDYDEEHGEDMYLEFRQSTR